MSWSEMERCGDGGVLCDGGVDCLVKPTLVLCGLGGERAGWWDVGWTVK